MAQSIERKILVKRREGLALALSGGGFRATLFHLGLLRRLNEINLLQKVNAISSVSGGSITNALLAKTEPHWKTKKLSDTEWNTIIRDPLVAVCTHNIRTKPILKSLFTLGKQRQAVDYIEKHYQELLTDQTLGDLPISVDFIFCASDIVFSTMWYYRRMTSANRRTGNHRAGWLRDWENIPVAQAVAASSCFPPVFSPQYLQKSPSDFIKPANPTANWEDLVSQVRLTDGGVYDNLGLEPVWDAYKYLICSDGGKPSIYKSSEGVGTLLRFNSLIQTQVANLRRRMLIERDTNPTLDFKCCYLGIHKGDTPGGYSAAFASEMISNIRTDLDSFSETEARVLENHNYFLADHYLKKYLIKDDFGLPFDKDALEAPAVPFPDEMNESKLRTDMKDSPKRTLLFSLRPSFL